MPLFHDVDALILLASSLAAKRRPAELADIMAALDLIHGNIPNEEKQVDAFVRLGETGLINKIGTGVALTADAEKIIEILPRKGEHELRLHELKGLLGAFSPNASHPAVLFTTEELRAAITEHRTAASKAGKNLLVPKPKPEASKARPGQRQRKPMPKQRKR